MNEICVILNKDNEKGRDSSNSIERNINDTTLSLQSFVNNIPFEFNQKYQTIILVSIYLIKKFFFLLFYFYKV